MRERLFLKFQYLFFTKHNIRNIFILVLIFFCPMSIFFKNKATIDILSCIVSSDMFNMSGILAGFVFTGLSFITVSDSHMIKNLKDTGNFQIIKNFYIHSIYSYVAVMLLYLLKPILLYDKSIFNENVTYTIFLKMYLLFIIILFIFACVLFLFCLFIINKRINE